jgi:hypothetical protein
MSSKFSNENYQISQFSTTFRAFPRARQRFLHNFLRFSDSNGLLLHFRLTRCTLLGFAHFPYALWSYLPPVSRSRLVNPIRTISSEGDPHRQK